MELFLYCGYCVREMGGGRWRSEMGFSFIEVHLIFIASFRVFSYVDATWNENEKKTREERKTWRKRVRKKRKKIYWLLNSRRASMCVCTWMCLPNADDIINEYVYIDSDTATLKTKGVRKKNDEKNRKKHTHTSILCWTFAIPICLTMKFVLFFSFSTRIG